MTRAIDPLSSTPDLKRSPMYMLYVNLCARAGRHLVGGAIGGARFYLRDLPISIDDADALPSRYSWFPTFLRSHGPWAECGYMYIHGFNLASIARSGGALMLRISFTHEAGIPDPAVQYIFQGTTYMCTTFFRVFAVLLD